jgi:hypothetical protein
MGGEGIDDDMEGYYMSTPLTDHRAAVLIEKGNHRFNWYSETYRHKPIKDASKRWWEAVAGELRRRNWDFNLQDLMTYIYDRQEKYAREIEIMGPYSERAHKRWGVTI